MVFEPKGKDKALNFKINEGLDSLVTLYQSIYQQSSKRRKNFGKLMPNLDQIWSGKEPQNLRAQDSVQEEIRDWFLSNELVGWVSM